MSCHASQCQEFPISKENKAIHAGAVRIPINVVHMNVIVFKNHFK